MTKKENLELREVFNQELIKQSDVFYNNCIEDAINEDYFVRLTHEMLEFLDHNFQNYGVDFVEDYSSIIGEIVYLSFYDYSLFPLNESLKKQIDADPDPSKGLEFHNLSDVENLVNSVSGNKGFVGIIQYFSHITYDNLNHLFIYSMLKYKNKK